jgi:enamine deaminase RidA (YjgF/YER057c/UK114 family)
MVRHFNPDTIGTPVAAYSHGSDINPNARYIFTAGQVGVGEDGKPLDGIEAQAEKVYANLLAILQDAGMGPANIVKMTTYLINPDDAKGAHKARARVLGDVKPPNTLLYIKRLANPDFLLEVELVAAAD